MALSTSQILAAGLSLILTASPSYTLSVRFLDKDSITRFDPSYPDVESRFERCKF